MIPQSMTHKILARRAGKDYVESGQIVETDIDMCFAHDPAIEDLRNWYYEEYGTDARFWDVDRVAFFQDHLVPAKDEISQRLQVIMNNFAAEQGVKYYYPYGKNYGVCHIVMCEEGLCLPGEVVIGCDSHSVTYGAFNSFGTGVGVVDLVAVLRTGKLWFKVPEVIEVRIDGTLPKNVQAKDIILRLIGDIGMDGGSGKTIEWTGSAVDKMSVEDRMTLCNMVVEAGATNGIMHMTPVVREYLKGRAKRSFEEVTTDEDFVYHRSIKYQAEELSPMVAFPHRPDNVHSIDKAKSDSIRVDQVYVGSCTGAKFEDISTVATTLEGKSVANNVRLMVVPASMDIYRRMVDSGVMSVLMSAGAVIESPGCKACFGAHGGVLGDDEVCLSTTNRNFRGRMGNPRSEVYLASPYVAARTALTGYITD